MRSLSRKEKVRTRKAFVMKQVLFVMMKRTDARSGTNDYLCKKYGIKKLGIIMKDFIGELMGTFVLTLLGCCSVAVAVLFGEYNSIFQIGLV